MPKEAAPSLEFKSEAFNNVWSQDEFDEGPGAFGNNPFAMTPKSNPASHNNDARIRELESHVNSLVCDYVRLKFAAGRGEARTQAGSRRAREQGTRSQGNAGHVSLRI